MIVATTQYSCSVCGKPVHVRVNGIERTCEHLDAGIVACLRANMNGIGGVDHGIQDGH